MKSTRVSPLRRILPVIAIALLGTGCDNNNNSESVGGRPFDELVVQGVTRFLGLYSPMSTTEKNGVVSYQFGTGDGPLCLRGTPYTMATRDQGSEELMIFLQGGGACWFDLCRASEEAEVNEDVLQGGILGPALPDNPLRDVSTVYLPYCDGGLHASDADRDTTGDGMIDRYHRGLHNLSAGLDVAVNTFPAPSKIVLAGVSGGGYGTIFALPLVSQLYPGVPIEVINDSGLGINRPDDPAFNEEIISYWNIGGFFPESCEECTVRGNPTEYLDWQLQQDPTIRLGLMSYTQDGVIGGFFLGLEGPVFEGILRDTVTELEARNPGRVRSFIAEGFSHTFLGNLSTEVQGTSVGEWVGSMVDGVAGNWETVSD